MVPLRSLSVSSKVTPTKKFSENDVKKISALNIKKVLTYMRSKECSNAITSTLQGDTHEEKNYKYDVRKRCCEVDCLKHEFVYVFLTTEKG